MKTKAKSAFTLLEMLVVIGIIGVLMGVIISQFGGATESAKAAKCETNMRNLVTAAHSCALEEENGHFPPAGSYSYEYIDHKKAEVVYHNYRVGWISGSERRPGVSKSPIAFQAIPFNADETTLRYALTNGCRGAMWKAMGASRTAYQCPVHAEAVRKEFGHMPGWSYAMNMDFGYDNNEHKWWGKTKDLTNGSRMLMFAELQGADIDESGYDPIKARKYIRAGVPVADAVLDYRNNESIGFNHKTSKRGVSGHVAFADGHVERLFYPKSGSGLSLQKLTEALCKGHEVSFDGKGYTDLQQ